MSTNTASAIAAALLGCAGAALLVGQTSQSSSTLPPGPMQAKATTACTECHEARIIVQQRLSKPLWTKEVDKMIKWGAVVEPAAREALIDYFSTNFPPDKPSYVASRTASTLKKSK